MHVKWPKPQPPCIFLLTLFFSSLLFSACDDPTTSKPAQANAVATVFFSPSNGGNNSDPMMLPPIRRNVMPKNATPSRGGLVAPGAAGLVPEEQVIISLINDYRRSNGLGELTTQANLIEAARWMSKDMGDKNYFNHNDSQGRDPFQRISDFGFNSDFEGENLAAGHESAVETLIQWKNSPAHNTELLTREYTLLGISRYQNPGSTFKFYWSLDFGNGS